MKSEHRTPGKQAWIQVRLSGQTATMLCQHQWEVASEASVNCSWTHAYVLQEELQRKVSEVFQDLREGNLEQEGFEGLYAFKEAHPDVDLWSAIDMVCSSCSKHTLA